MKYCPNCGNKIEGKNFCDSCGLKNIVSDYEAPVKAESSQKSNSYSNQTNNSDHKNESRDRTSGGKSENNDATVNSSNYSYDYGYTMYEDYDATRENLSKAKDTIIGGLRDGVEVLKKEYERKRKEEEVKTAQYMEEMRMRQEAEKHRKEEAQKKAAEAEAIRRQKEAEELAKRQAEEANRKKMAEEEAKRRAEEELKRKKLQEEYAKQKLAEENARKRKEEEAKKNSPDIQDDSCINSESENTVNTKDTVDKVDEPVAVRGSSISSNGTIPENEKTNSKLKYGLIAAGVVIVILAVIIVALVAKQDNQNMAYDDSEITEPLVVDEREDESDGYITFVDEDAMACAVPGTYYYTIEVPVEADEDSEEDTEDGKESDKASDEELTDDDTDKSKTASEDNSEITSGEETSETDETASDENLIIETQSVPCSLTIKEDSVIVNDMDGEAIYQIKEYKPSEGIIVIESEAAEEPIELLFVDHKTIDFDGNQCTFDSPDEITIKDPEFQIDDIKADMSCSVINKAEEQGITWLEVTFIYTDEFDNILASHSDYINLCPYGCDCKLSDSFEFDSEILPENGYIRIANYYTDEEAPVEEDYVPENITAKYPVTLDVDCYENLMFSQYDVEVRCGGIGGLSEVLDHGAEDCYEIYLTPGTHEFECCSVDSLDVDGKTNIEVLTDKENHYWINLSCKSDRIKIYMEDTIYPPGNVNDYIGKSYKEVITAFESAGFLNVKGVAVKKIESEDDERLNKTGKIKIAYNGKVIDKFTGYEAFNADNYDKVRIAYYDLTDSAKEEKIENTEDDDTTTLKIKKGVLLPPDRSKLDKDFDDESETTLYYINVDNISNIPKVVEWKKIKVTDGMKEYLEFLEDQGATIKVTDYKKKNPWDNFYTYDSCYTVKYNGNEWDMCLYIQDEDYVEYELDINF